MQNARNASQWRDIRDFLGSDHFPFLKLTSSLDATASAERSEAASRAGASSLPDGNHGDNNSEATT